MQRWPGMASACSRRMSAKTSSCASRRRVAMRALAPPGQSPPRRPWACPQPRALLRRRRSRLAGPTTSRWCHSQARAVLHRGSIRHRPLRSIPIRPTTCLRIRLLGLRSLSASTPRRTHAARVILSQCCCGSPALRALSMATESSSPPVFRAAWSMGPLTAIFPARRSM